MALGWRRVAELELGLELELELELDIVRLCGAWHTCLFVLWWTNEKKHLTDQ